MLALRSPFPLLGNGYSFSIQRSKRDCLHRFNPKKLRKWRNCKFSVFSSMTEAWVEKVEEMGRIESRIPAMDGCFPAGLSEKLMPKHVAVIMDGNSRWARERGLPVAAGHEAGVRAFMELVKLSYRWGIEVLTIFSFSSDNWLRPNVEVNFLMKLFEGVLKEELDNLTREGIRFCVIGDTSKLPESLRRMVSKAEETTKNNSRLKVIAALSYSGRNDIVQACQRIAHKIKDGELEPTDIDESLFDRELETSWKIDAPSPDLLIRTSGEIRVSNFLLWQLAYTELFFLGLNWPDFGEAQYVEALRSYQNRHRRFGKRSG